MTHRAFEHASKKGQKIGAKLRCEMPRVLGTHNNHSGQTACTEIQFQAGLGPQMIGVFGPKIRRLG